MHEMRKVEVTAGRTPGRSVQGFRHLCSRCVLLMEWGRGREPGFWRSPAPASLSPGPVHMHQFGRRYKLLRRVPTVLRVEVVRNKHKFRLLLKGSRLSEFSFLLISPASQVFLALASSADGHNFRPTSRHEAPAFWRPLHRLPRLYC